jgi:hypothetical protein
VAIFEQFQIYRNARLRRTLEDPDLFFAAMNSTSVELTVQDKAYRGFVEDRCI